MSESAPHTPSLDSAAALAVGTRVGEFEVRGVLGSGGFGIVYLAWDHALEREVALKEYMPGTLAGRGDGLTVQLRSQAHADTFALGLRSFVNEARMLARFNHPALVKVYRFWEGNGTAYMVMPRYLGRTLRQVRAGMVVPPGETACRRVLGELLSALEVLHKEGVFHRDIAPDNILLGDDGAPVLLDFGAARRVLGEGNQALTSIMKPHYAPLEQYADQSAMRQGPWTDLYALGGTLYFLITGREPVPAASRALHDDQPRLSNSAPAYIAPNFLDTIDWMLALRPTNRPQNVQMLRDVLDGRAQLPARPADRTQPGVAPLSEVDIDTGPGNLVTLSGTPSQPAVLTSGAVTQVMAAAPEPAAAPAPAPAESVAIPREAAPMPPAARASRRALLGVLGLLMVLNVLAWWWFTRPGTEAAPSSPSAAASVPGRAAASAAVAALPGASAPPAPADFSAAPTDAPGETILSVLPARPGRPGAASAPASAGSASAAAAAAPRVEPLPGVSRNPEGLGAAGPAPTLVLPPAARPRSAELQGPRARCGDRNFITLLICMKSECESAALRAHPECVRMREQEDAQQQHQR